MIVEDCSRLFTNLQGIFPFIGYLREEQIVTRFAYWYRNSRTQCSAYHTIPSRARQVSRSSDSTCFKACAFQEAAEHDIEASEHHNARWSPSKSAALQRRSTYVASLQASYPLRHCFDMQRFRSICTTEKTRNPSTRVFWMCSKTCSFFCESQMSASMLQRRLAPITDSHPLDLVGSRAPNGYAI